MLSSIGDMILCSSSSPVALVPEEDPEVLEDESSELPGVGSFSANSVANCLPCCTS